MKYSGKLELTWVNKEKELNIEPRILVEDKTKSYGDPNSKNMLIHGDNLIALKALERDFAGKIKCIFIDPPYNTGSAFEHYDDNVEHSIWLSLMNARLRLLKTLLSEDGTIWIVLDDSELHYCKVLCDEIWGRKNFIADITWNSRKSVSNDAILSLNTNHIIVYATDIEVVRQLAKKSILFKGPIDESKFSNPDNDPRGKWVADPFDAPNIRPNLTYPIVNPNTGETFMPPSGRCWRTTPEKYQEALADNRIVFGKTGKSKPQMKRFLSECGEKGTVLTTLWDDLDTTTNATKHSQKMFGKSFTNPKPEDLIERVISLSTKPGDWVLDSFLGSGTTCAAAHKMKRKWIGIEMGDQAYEFCKKRMDLIIDNLDDGGITHSQNWLGGGGYKFYELAEPLLVKNPIIPVYEVNPTYTFEMVCEAICKIEGFTYAPSDFYHGYSTENRFIHVTFDYVNGEYISELESKLTDKQSLIIYCLKYQRDMTLPDNIEVRRIPKDIQEKCNFESEEE